MYKMQAGLRHKQTTVSRKSFDAPAIIFAHFVILQPQGCPIGGARAIWRTQNYFVENGKLVDGWILLNILEITFQ